MRRRMIALVTAGALALAAPAVGIADQGGVPNDHSQPCPSKAEGNGPKRDAPNDNGKKCGFDRSNGQSKPCPSKAEGNGPKRDAPNDKGKKCGFVRHN